MKKKYCCICGKEITNWGNNPYGVIRINEKGKIENVEFKDEDVCCDECNMRYVIPGRLRTLYSKIDEYTGENSDEE